MKLPMNIYVIEDNIFERKETKNELALIEQAVPTLSFSIQTIDNYIQFFESIKDFPINELDLFFIDIHLNSYFTGIDLAKEIRKKNQHVFIVFLTSDSLSSIQVINQKTFPYAYLLKTTEKEVFHESLKQTLKNIEQEILLKKTNTNDFIILKQGTKKVLINPSTIYYVHTLKGNRGKLIIQTDTNVLFCDGKISDLKKQLSKENFFLELKSYIIGLAHIQSYNRTEGTVYFDKQLSLTIGIKPIDKLIKSIFS